MEGHGSRTRVTPFPSLLKWHGDLPLMRLLDTIDTALILETKFSSAPVMGGSPNPFNMFSSSAGGTKQDLLTCPASLSYLPIGSSLKNLSWIIKMHLHLTIHFTVQLSTVPGVLDVGLRMLPCPLNTQGTMYRPKTRFRLPAVGPHQGALSVEAVHGMVSSRIVHLFTQMHMLTRLFITNNPDPERGLSLSSDAKGIFSSCVRS